MDCAIIIPVTRREPSLPCLLQAIADAGWADEVLVCGAEKPAELPDNVQWVQSSAGRAASMNAGAAKTQAEHLWFVHADSQISSDNVGAVSKFSAKHPTAIGYFDLKFYDGSPLMRITEAGVWLRCRLLHSPFGDQGLCMSKAQFDALGGYDEDAAYGEDHLLVLRAHQRRIAVLPMGGALQTSARKYVQNGWLNTTRLHQKLWWKQRAQNGKTP